MKTPLLLGTLALGNAAWIDLQDYTGGADQRATINYAKPCYVSDKLYPHSYNDLKDSILHYELHEAHKFKVKPKITHIGLKTIVEINKWGTTTFIYKISPEGRNTFLRRTYFTVAKNHKKYLAEISMLVDGIISRAYFYDCRT